MIYVRGENCTVVKKRRKENYWEKMFRRCPCLIYEDYEVSEEELQRLERLISETRRKLDEENNRE